MKFLLKDVSLTKKNVYKLEIVNYEKKDLEFIRKELNLKKSTILFYKKENVFYISKNVEYYSSYKLDELIKQIKNYKNSIVVISLESIKNNFQNKTEEEIFLILEGFSLILDLKFVVYCLNENIK